MTSEPTVFYHHNNDAERSLLSAMMLDPDCIDDVLTVLSVGRSDWFFDRRHNVLFGILVEAHETGRPLDTVLVKEYVGEKRLADAGGLEYVGDLHAAPGYASNALHYAKIVRDAARLRSARLALEAGLAVVSNATISEADDVLGGVEQSILGATEQRIDAGPVDLATAADEALAAIEARRGGGLAGIATGLRAIDDVVLGLQGGELVILAGRPSMGKTSMGLTWAQYNAIDEGKTVLFFSLEMSARSVGSRVLCALAGVPFYRTKSGCLSMGELRRLRAAKDAIKAGRLILDTPSQTVADMRAKARRQKRNGGLDIVFVDYVGIVKPPKADSREQAVATIVRELKQMAQELDVPVVAMAQLNRASEGNEGHRPRLSSLRESGSLEQDADVAILLHRPEYYRHDDRPGIGEAIIAKQRNGPTGTVDLKWLADRMLFADLDTGNAAGTADTAGDEDFVAYEDIQSPWSNTP